MKPAVSRVVILGNSGFVGRRLEKAFAGAAVAVQGFSSRELNLLNPESVGQLSAVLRPEDTLVIISALTPDQGRDLGTLTSNIRMIEHVCAALKDRTCAHIVYISSDAVYADDAHPVRETSSCDPSSFHGLMHLVRERALEAAAKSKKIPLMIIRPCAIYGPGDTHNSYGPNRFVRTAAKDRRIQLFGNGEEQRDHVHVDDVVKIVEQCIERRAEGILNIATGNAVSFSAVAQMISELYDNAVSIQGSPRQNPITHRHFDVTRLLRAFPAFRFTVMRDGLAEMVKNEY